jgi:hypothetical protein
MVGVPAKMVTFNSIEPCQTERLWPVLKGIVAEIQSRSPESVDWQPEDLARMLLVGNSRLVLINEGEKCIGWFIFRVLSHEITKKPTSRIWLFGLFPEHRKGIGQLRIIATEIFDWLQTEYPMPLEIISRRRGWERVFKNILTFKYIAFGREVPA